MDFLLQTPVKLDTSKIKIEPDDNMFIVGSCFAENIGHLMTKGGINTCANPFGIIYNPVSITETINFIVNQRRFTEEDIFEQDGIFKSYFFHSRHTSINKNQCIDRMNELCQQATLFVQRADKIMITLGTSFVFQHKTTAQIVANCHKTPALKFEKILLAPEEIIQKLSHCIAAVRTINPDIPFIFTVSPIRHLRDGLHKNQISKSILHYAIHQIIKNINNTHYFPAYEIMIDELRDYRFYATDMVHPSELAIQYIWEKFCKTWCSSACNVMMEEVVEIRKATLHQWQHPSQQQINHFATLHLNKINHLVQNFPHLDLHWETSYFKSLLTLR